MNIIELAKQANRYASNQTNDSHDWQSIRDERFAHLVRAAALEEAIKIIEEYRIPVGNSAAGEMACEWTYDALHRIRDDIRELKEKT